MIFQNYSMGHIKMKLKDHQPTNGIEQQQEEEQPVATTELNRSGPIIETSPKVFIVSTFQYQGRVSCQDVRLSTDQLTMIPRPLY